MRTTRQACRRRAGAGSTVSRAASVLAVAFAAASCGDGGQGASAQDLPSSRDLPSAQELPEGVTPAMVARGQEIFRGTGFCHNCHGRDGAGLPQLGSDLTSGVWHHSDGSYAALVERIDRGVSAELSRTGMPMPPRGGARLTDEQLRSVAAYVWTLSRR